jgi:Mannosyltransferase (PIG-V)
MSAVDTTPERGAGEVVRLRDGVRYAVVVFLAVRVALSLVSVVTVGLFELPPDTVSIGVAAEPGLHNALDGTDRWDAWWFQDIAVHGYAEDKGAAFFPGYPLLIRGVIWALPVGSLGAALLVSNACFLGALIVLYALTSREFDEDTARRSVVLLAVFPTSFFFLAPYSESAFLFAVLLAFWWVRSDRWAAGGASGFAAALVRSFGAALTPAFVVEAWQGGHDGRVRRLAFACAPVLGVLAYSAYWYARSGDALRAMHAQGAWLRSFEFFVYTLGWAVALGLRGLAHLRGLYWTTDLVLTGILLVPALFRRRWMAPTYLVYVVSVGLVTLSFTLPDRPLLSDPRLLLILFPSFWAMASILGKRGYVPAVIIFAVGYAIAASIFMNWGFVL